MHDPLGFSDDVKFTWESLDELGSIPTTTNLDELFKVVTLD